MSKNKNLEILQIRLRNLQAEGLIQDFTMQSDGTYLVTPNCPVEEIPELIFPSRKDLTVQNEHPPVTGWELEQAIGRTHRERPLIPKERYNPEPPMAVCDSCGDRVSHSLIGEPCQAKTLTGPCTGKYWGKET